MSENGEGLGSDPEPSRPAAETDATDDGPARIAEIGTTPDRPSAAARLFDLRLMIGGLFLVYGVLLAVAGLWTSPAETAKSAGININLWLGLGLIVVAAVFLTWRRLRPVRHEADRSVDNGTV
jgi:hypothetical protein